MPARRRLDAARHARKTKREGVMPLTRLEVPLDLVSLGVVGALPGVHARFQLRFLLLYGGVDADHRVLDACPQCLGGGGLLISIGQHKSTAAGTGAVTWFLWTWFMV